MSPWIWILIGTTTLLLGALFYWALVITEGAYMGARVVAWTYDLVASRYDSIKQFNPTHDKWLLSGPLLHKLRDVHGPLILDVATGTGRVPLLLMENPQFQGYVVGLDLAARMLDRAQDKLAGHQGRYGLIRHDARDLPFPDQVFDAVSCLEALEFMPSPQRVIDEMARVLRPGGVFLITNRVNWERRLMPGKAFSTDEMRQMLQHAGLTGVEIRPWQVYYDLIWAQKPGSRSRLGHGTWDLENILRCPQCHSTPLQEAQTAWRCSNCGREYPVENRILVTDSPVHTRQQPD